MKTWPYVWRMEESCTHCTVSIGGGPRAVAQILAELDLIEKNRHHFDEIKKYGGRYDIRFKIIERRAHVGAGEAWNCDQGLGTSNSGAEAGEGRLNYSLLHRRLIDGEYENLRRRYIEACPPIAALLNEARRSNRQEGVERCAMLPRQVIGEAEMHWFQSALKESRNFAEFYHVELITNAEATQIDIDNPMRPKVTVMFRAENRVDTLRANIVRLNTGTTLTNPVVKDDILRYVYQGPMNPQKLKKFLDDLGLLDNDGKLIPGKKLGIGGTGLSCLDQLLALHEVMSLTETDDSVPLGYKVSAFAGERYRGSLVIASSTMGKFVPPRHSHDPVWPFDEEPFGTAEELHALFLHNQGEAVLQYWYPLVIASIGASLGLTPAEVEQKNLTTEELLRQQKAGTDLFLKHERDADRLSGVARQAKMAEARRTSLYAARRGAFLGTILGYGMTRDAESTSRHMKKVAPITFRDSYSRARASVKAVTEPGSVLAEDNAAIMSVHARMMADITASPLRIHALAALLFEAHIAGHVEVSYEKIRLGENGGLVLPQTSGDNVCVDAFVVSPVFQYEADIAARSLQDHHLPILPNLPMYGKVGVHRRRFRRDGKLSNVEDFSLNGVGGKVPGSNTLIGAFGFDLNNKDSAVYDAPGLAHRNMAKAHLKAVGFPDVDEYVDKLYKEEELQASMYDEEVQRFHTAFDSAVSKALFIKAVAAIARNDGRKYAALARKCLTREEREEVVRHCSQEDDPDVQEAIRQYRYDVEHRPLYRPASACEYKDRYVDVAPEVHRAVYRKAFEDARSFARINRCAEAGQKFTEADAAIPRSES